MIKEQANESVHAKTFEHVVDLKGSIITCSSQNVLRKNHTKLKVNREARRKQKRTQL